MHSDDVNEIVFAAGQFAFAQGWDVDANPYSKGETILFLSWFWGYEFASM